MGKYTRKSGMTTLDVPLTDVSHSYLGVRTRAKTLALQRLQSATETSNPDACYLQLRSRRLEKPMHRHNSRSGRQGCDKAEIGSRQEFLRSGAIEAEGLGTDGASFGENDLDCPATERGTRESTPCSLIMAADAITTPCSTTKRICSSTASQRIRNAVLLNVPSANELEEFFAREEQSLQRHFVEKYNFDIVNDLPLPGRYEWVAVRP